MQQRDLFISHASQDAAVAQELRAVLEGAGYTCWMAPDDIVGSRPWAEQILSAIESTRVMVVLISQHANDSVHVSREVNLALGRARAVLPVRIEEIAPGGSLEYLLSLVQRVDAFPPPVSMHTARIRRMIDAILDNLPEGVAQESSDALAVAGGHAVPTEPPMPPMPPTPTEPPMPPTPPTDQVRAAAVGPAGDQSGPDRRAASRGRARVALAVGAGAVVLVGLAILGGILSSGGVASSQAPGNTATADRATPSSSVTAPPSPEPPPSTAATAPGSPVASESPAAPTPVSPSASAAAEELMTLIPEAAGSCGSPMASDGSTWIAQFVCSSAAASAAVAYYSYSRYPDSASMRADYQMWLNYYEVRSKAAGPCGDGLEEEGAWSPDATSSEIDDRFFCGTKDGSPGIMWTDAATNVLAEIKGADGADLGELYNLWSSRNLDPVRP